MNMNVQKTHAFTVLLNFSSPKSAIMKIRNCIIRLLLFYKRAIMLIRAPRRRSGVRVVVYSMLLPC